MSARTIFESLKRDGWSLLLRWIVEGEQESQHLEVKCAQMDGGAGKLSDKTAADLAKAISGLANAEGGVILVGVYAGKPSDGGDDRILRIDPVPGLPAFARAVGENLARFVDPQVPAIHAWPILAPDDDSCGVLAIYVPSTDAGPFRTGRNLFSAKGGTKDVSERYYLRNGPNTNVMSHSSLADRFGRTARPRLRLAVKVKLIKDRVATLEIWLRNTGRGSARAAAAHFEIPASHLQPGHVQWVNSASGAWVTRNRETTGGRLLMFHAQPDFVLFPDADELLCTATVVQTQPDGGFLARFAGVLYALDMQPIRIDDAAVVGPGSAFVLLPADE